MDDERLIENVRVYDELYDMTNKKYSDNIHKDEIWKKIGTELNTAVCHGTDPLAELKKDLKFSRTSNAEECALPPCLGSACKVRWISLRDQYRKALKKKTTKSGQAAENSKKWKYEDLMAFLQPYLRERETQSNILTNTSKESDNEEIDDPIEKENINIEQSTSRTKLHLPAKKSYNKNKKETASSVLMKYLIETDKPSASSPSDPIDLFFNGIAATVKQLTPEYQHRAKTKIFSVVSELEWAYLQERKRVQEDSSANSFHSLHYPPHRQQQIPETQHFQPYQNIQTSNQNLHYSNDYRNVHQQHTSTSTPASTLSSTPASTPSPLPQSPSNTFYELL